MVNKCWKFPPSSVQARTSVVAIYVTAEVEPNFITEENTNYNVSSVQIKKFRNQ